MTECPLQLSLYGTKLSLENSTQSGIIARLKTHLNAKPSKTNQLVRERVGKPKESGNTLLRNLNKPNQSNYKIQCYWFPHPPRQNIGSTWCQQMFAVIFDKSHFGEVKVIWSRFCHKYDPDLNFSVQPEVGSTRWKLSISVNSL